jgi:protocatechuate 3,4-dioxygenase, beta subunit
MTQRVELAGYRRDDQEVDPPYLSPDYMATRTRAPKRPLLILPHTLTEVTGPVYGHERLGELDHDLTRRHDGEPLGERIILHGRVTDGNGRPVRNTLIEIWQANAAGRYHHVVDRHPAPLDPNFTGAGRAMTDDGGRYRFITVKPGAYPWQNHANAWRAAHVHMSLFGPAFATRLVTQMYFPGDPLFYQDPIFQSVRDPNHRDLMISEFDLSETVPEWALAYRFDVVLRGRDATPMEE